MAFSFRKRLKRKGKDKSTSKTTSSGAFLKLKQDLAERERIEKEATDAAAAARANDAHSSPRAAKSNSSSGPNPVVFFEIGASTSRTGSATIPLGRIEMELFRDAAPRTVENFLALCRGDRGRGASGFPLDYKGSPLHRIIPGFMAQGGDTTRGDGTGGESIFGRTFADEVQALRRHRHDKRGVLSMANRGKNTNGSQYFLLFAPARHLDGKHVVFGHVCSGLNVLDRIERYGTESGTPTSSVEVTSCGEVRRRRERSRSRSRSRERGRRDHRHRDRRRSRSQSRSRSRDRSRRGRGAGAAHVSSAALESQLQDVRSKLRSLEKQADGFGDVRHLVHPLEKLEVALTDLLLRARELGDDGGERRITRAARGLGDEVLRLKRDVMQRGG